MVVLSGPPRNRWGSEMSIITILLIILLVGLILSVFNGTSWGYGPSGIIGVLLVILLILYLTGYVR